jgi:DNA repair protein RecO (recombination protein O)
MSTIVKTEAIVLRSIDFKESSKIVTFYTRQFGKIAGMVKGARQPKNKYGSSLEPMSYVALVIYKKEGRDVQTISHCDLIKPFRKLYEDLDKMSVGMAMIELVNIVAHEQEQNVELFTLLQRSLSVLNTATRSPQILLYYFEIQLARALGFEPSFVHCVSCKKELKEVVDGCLYKIHLEKGGLICTKCSAISGHTDTLPADILKIFRLIVSSNDLELVLSIDLSEQIENIIQSFLWTYLQYHVSGLRSLKSDRVFSKMFKGLENTEGK